MGLGLCPSERLAWANSEIDESDWRLVAHTRDHVGSCQWRAADRGSKLKQPHMFSAS